MIEMFNPKDINKSASIYNTEKLDWLNAHYIKNMPNEHLKYLLEDYDIILTSNDKTEILLDNLKERAKTLRELAWQIKDILTQPGYENEKAFKKAFKGNAVDILTAFSNALKSAPKPHLPVDFHTVMQSMVDELDIGFGKLGQPLRVALLGKLSGPGLDSVMAVIGVEETINRISSAVSYAVQNGYA